MTTDLKDVLEELNNKITEVYDLDLAEEMSDIYIDLVHRVDVMSKKYWKLVKALATIEKERDEFYKKFKKEEMRNKSMLESLTVCIDTAKKMLEEEREIQDNIEKERDQAEYDKNYYRNELDKEIEFQRDFLMNKLTGKIE